MEQRIEKMIRSTNELFDAIQTVGNEAHRQGGYNTPFEFSSGLTASYELYDKGPEHLHYSQYARLNDEELGKQIDPEREGLSGGDLFWTLEDAYRRITIADSGVPACRIEGKRGFRMSLHTQGPWEEKLREWFRVDGGVLR